MWGFLKRLTGSGSTEQPKEEHKSSLPKKKSQIEKFNARYQTDVFTTRNQNGDPFIPHRKQTRGKLNSTKRQSHRPSIKSFDEMERGLDPFD